MMLQTTPDKRGTILAAAFDVFINYGFRKTSMDDIARAAGMSRPALYQVFRNKTEIFRAASLSILENVGHEARQPSKATSHLSNASTIRSTAAFSPCTARSTRPRMAPN
jgi:AcrR family transcriptional regulator